MRTITETEARRAYPGYALTEGQVVIVAEYTDARGSVTELVMGVGATADEAHAEAQRTRRLAQIEDDGAELVPYLVTGPDARERLSALIDASDLSIVAFAEIVMGRDERTVRRWLAGETIPEGVRQWLARVDGITTDTDTVAVTLRR